MDLLDTSEHSLSTAVNHLKEGQVIAFPTDTVYGLGASIHSEKAIRRLFEVKKRPFNKALPVLCADIAQIESLTQDPPELFYLLAHRFFPGALTLILKKAPSVPDLITAHQNTIGVRIPRHPFTLNLIKALGHPIVTTSANLSAQPPATTAQMLINQIGSEVSLIIVEETPTPDKPSTILDLSQTPPSIIREGSLSQTLKRLLKQVARL